MEIGKIELCYYLKMEEINNLCYRFYKNNWPEGKLIRNSEIWKYICENHPIGHILKNYCINQIFDNLPEIKKFKLWPDKVTTILGLTYPIEYAQELANHGLLDGINVFTSSNIQFNRIVVYNKESTELLYIHANLAHIKEYNGPIYLLNSMDLIIDKPTIIIGQANNIIYNYEEPNSSD